MSLLREPADWSQPERDSAASAQRHRKVTRRATQRVGHGAFACPSCDLPLLPIAPVSASARIECPFCGQVDPAGRFLRLGAVDTPSNAVHVHARLPAG
jgi:hypothetical protein